MCSPAVRRTGLADLFGRVAQLPPRELLTMTRVALVVMLVEMLIRWVSLPRLSRLLGVRINLEPSGRHASDQLPLDELPPWAQRAVRCTSRVTRTWPFCSGPCLRSALVGAHLLRSLEPAVRIGITGVGHGLSAHAWIEIDERPLEAVGAFSAFQRSA